jgi:putative peptidoglycan lipid II flippase
VSSLLRSNITVAFGTALSRVTGLLRLMVFGWIIGQTALSDAYVIANETPNIVYDLLLGGVLSATLVPLFSSFIEADDDEATSVVITVAATLMAALTVVAVIAAPLIFRLYSLDPGGDVDPAMFHRVGTTLAQIFLLQIFFYGLTGLASAYLNSRRLFFAAAWSPVVSNLIIIATLFTLRGRVWGLADIETNDRLKWTLGLGATAGIAVMALLTVAAARRSGFRLRFAWNLKHPAVKQVAKLSGWTLGFATANQIALIVVRNLAEPGSSIATAYFVAFTFFVLPHGLLAVSISTTFQPELARAVHRKDRPAFIEQTSLGVRLIVLLTLPAGLVMFALRRPIVGALLEYRNFSSSAAENTVRALAGFSLGLVGFSVYQFVLRGFYAHKDTRTAFVVNVAENAINIVLAILLVGRYGVLGLGLAYALAYLVSAVLVLKILSTKVRGFALRPIAEATSRMAIAAVLMAEAVWIATRSIGSDHGGGAFARLLSGGVVAPIVYIGVLIALRAPEVASLRNIASRRRD